MKSKSLLLFLFFVGTLLIDGALFAQPNRKVAWKNGYVLPAGVQRGTTTEVWVCGRQMSRCVGAVFTGTGITVKVLDTFPSPRNLEQLDRYVIRTRVEAVAARLLAKLDPEAPDTKVFVELLKKLPKDRKPELALEEEILPFIWPRYWYLRKIAEEDSDLSLEDFRRLVYQIYGPPQWRRPPDALMETVLLEVTVEPNAEPGDRELRLVMPNGLTNPMYFQVGVHPEVLELEPNCRESHWIADWMNNFTSPVYDVPVVINGQITYSDIDQFRFRAKKGQNLVLTAQARQLVPYIADAVPGWFSAVLTIYDANGREWGYADCFRFNPDPVLYFTAPEDGEYTVEIRDSLFRGREDFVYRLTIAPTPVVESVFPLGVKEGTTTKLQLTGRNLPVNEITVEAKPGSGHIQEISQIGGQWLPYPIRYTVDTLPEIMKSGGNNAPASAQPVALPLIVNGTVSKSGEYDFYRFDGKEGDTVVLDVTARALGSQLDSRIALLDASGKILAGNDDRPALNERYLSLRLGLQTHDADSYLMAKLPTTGTFFVRIGDTQRGGGPAYGYRLRISSPEPEFTVYSTPSTHQLAAGGIYPIWFHVDRQDGYDGPIQLRISGDPKGFQLDSAFIPSKESDVFCTLTTPPESDPNPIPLRFEAFVEKDGRTIRRSVAPVEDMEQAFLYHHWVPADDLWVTIPSKRSPVGVQLTKPEPIQLKPGTSVDVVLETPKGRSYPENLMFKLAEAMPGVSVRKKSHGDNLLTLTFSAAPDVFQKIAEKEEWKEPKSSLGGNFIIEMEAENQQKQRYSMGLIPAIPFRIE